MFGAICAFSEQSDQNIQRNTFGLEDFLLSQCKKGTIKNNLLKTKGRG